MKKFPLKLNISNAQREKISLSLKVVLFAFVLIWDMYFILGAMLLFNQFISIVPRGGVFILLPTWYLITMVFIGVWVASKGFQIIGKWEYPKAIQQPQKPKK